MKIDLLNRARLELLNKKGAKYNLQDAEKDYFLAVTLNIIYNSELKDILVFKGGTAIYHCYLEQLRFSTDLDFTARGKIKPEDIEKIFSKYEMFKIKDIEEKKFGLGFSAQYKGVLTQPNTIEVDINTNQKVILKPQVLKYKNYFGVEIECPVMDKKEIFAEKIRTINERAKPRDLYDLIILQKEFGLSIDSGLELLTKKEITKPLDPKSVAENLRISEERFEQDMKGLYYKEVPSKEEMQRFSKEIQKKVNEFRIIQNKKTRLNELKQDQGMEL